MLKEMEKGSSRCAREPGRVRSGALSRRCKISSNRSSAGLGEAYTPNPTAGSGGRSASEAGERSVAVRTARATTKDPAKVYCARRAMPIMAEPEALVDGRKEGIEHSIYKE
jgi:hypothetical protein